MLEAPQWEVPPIPPWTQSDAPADLQLGSPIPITCFTANAFPIPVTWYMQPHDFLVYMHGAKGTLRPITLPVMSCPAGGKAVFSNFCTADIGCRSTVWWASSPGLMQGGRLRRARGLGCCAYTQGASKLSHAPTDSCACKRASGCSSGDTSNTSLESFGQSLLTQLSSMHICFQPSFHKVSE